MSPGGLQTSKSEIWSDIGVPKSKILRAFAMRPKVSFGLPLALHFPRFPVLLGCAELEDLSFAEHSHRF